MSRRTAVSCVTDAEFCRSPSFVSRNCRAENMTFRSLLLMTVLFPATPVMGQETTAAARSSAAVQYGHLFAGVPLAQSGMLSAPNSQFSSRVAGSARRCTSCENCSTCAAACSKCCSPCDETGRRYALDVNAVFLFRNRSDSRLLFVNPVVPGENINAAQFRFGAAPGVDAGLTLYELHDLTDVEFRATWIDDWVGDATQAFSGASVQFAMNPPVGTSGPRNGFVIYGSEFFSSEVNVRFRSHDKSAQKTNVHF